MDSAAAILAKQKGKKKKSPYNKDQVHAAAQEFGSLGGAVGGPARAEALSDERRSEIARKAANIRWGN